MITAAQIKTALRVWLEDATSLTVIYANQAGPRPGHTYVLLNLLGIRNVGFDDRGTIDDVTTEQDMKGDRVLTASINVIGTDAWDKARDAANAVNLITARDKLRAAYLFPRRITALDDLTTLLDTEWEPRFHFDADFGFTDEYVDTVGLIESVEVTEEYPGHVDLDSTYTIPPP